MNTIAQQLAEVQAQITQAESRFNRPAGSVQLLAVSKTRPIIDIQTAFSAGQRTFAENYLQDALPKIEALKNNIEWHYIGPLQSNKTRQVAENFHWLHTLDRLKIAQRLNDQRPHSLPPLNICLQVNISQDPDKSGISLEQTEALANQIISLPKLKLRGLMTIPKKEAEFEKQRASFAALRELYENLNKNGLDMDTLSMGMTNDLDAAIAEGATIVRVGTGIFGERDKAQ